MKYALNGFLIVSFILYTLSGQGVCLPLSAEGIDTGPVETNELINKIYDGSADKLFAALLSRKKHSAEEIEKLKQIVADLE